MRKALVSSASLREFSLACYFLLNRQPLLYYDEEGVETHDLREVAAVRLVLVIDTGIASEERENVLG